MRDRTGGRGLQRCSVHDRARHPNRQSHCAGHQAFDEYSLAKRMPDIIDMDTGPIISGESTIEQMGEQVLEYVVRVASGEVHTKAEQKNQEDFIPWKRGVSL